MRQFFTIDNGNSNPNVGLFEDGELREVLLKAAFLERFAEGVPAQSVAMMADVGQTNELPALFGARLMRMGRYRTAGAFLDMPVNYGMTLGEDRLALAYHACKTLPMALPALIIDGGTFMTMDVVDNNGLQGGYIFPGLRRLYETYGKSARLPNLSQAPLPPYAACELPHATTDAILQAGLLYVRGILREVLDGPARQAQTLIITGGDAGTIEGVVRELFPGMKYIVDPKLMHLSLYTVFTAIEAFKMKEHN